MDEVTAPSTAITHNPNGVPSKHLSTAVRSLAGVKRHVIDIYVIGISLLVIFTVTPSKTEIKTIECLKPRI